MLVFLAIALWFLWIPNQPWHLGAGIIHRFQAASAFMFFFGVVYTARHEIYASQVATLRSQASPTSDSRTSGVTASNERVITLLLRY
jgi:hypothetical protein